MRLIIDLACNGQIGSPPTTPTCGGDLALPYPSLYTLFHLDLEGNQRKSPLDAYHNSHPGKKRSTRCNAKNVRNLN